MSTGDAAWDGVALAGAGTGEELVDEDAPGGAVDPQMVGGAEQSEQSLGGTAAAPAALAHGPDAPAPAVPPALGHLPR